MTTFKSTDRDLKSRAKRLIAGQNTMTLATAHESMAWAAPVYYANMGFQFYFFSDPESRHIRESLESDQASAAIFVPASTWKEIRGVQMSGSVHGVSPGLESIKALRLYLKKYPFTKDFFESGENINIEDIVKRFRVKLYRFKPSLFYYLDNQIRFGFRESISVA